MGHVSEPDAVIGIEWVVACVAPHDVAPHPNFRIDSVRPVELLALLAKSDFRDLDHYQERVDKEGKAVAGTALTLLAKARSSLVASSQEMRESAALDLLEVAETRSLPLGLRAAAVLFASVVSSEVDNLSLVIDVLRQILSDSYRVRTRHHSSLALLRAVLHQQFAMRSLEEGDADAAREHAREVTRVLGDVEVESWQEFPVSRGISWDAVESQRRLVEQIKNNALSLEVQTQDGFSGNWADLVRRSGAINDLRPSWETVSGLSSFVDEMFKDQYVGDKKIRFQFRSADPVFQPLVASLFNAEVTGSVSRVLQLRQLIGKTLALRAASSDEPSELYSEAIRLLRQADATDDLRRLLRLLRMSGPSDVLADAATRFLKGPGVLRSPNQSDLALLELASDFLDSELRETALGLALTFPDEGNIARLSRVRTVDWRRLELGLQAVAALVPGSSQDDLVALRVLDLAKRVHADEHQFVFAAVLDVVVAIDWDQVTSGVAENWRRWTNSIRATNEIPPNDLKRLADLVGAELASVAATERLTGLEYVVHVLNRRLDRDGPNGSEVDRAAAICGDVLQEQLDDAEKGSYAGRTYSPPQLASILIEDFGRVELWRRLMSVLLHPGIPDFDKVSSLNRLAAASVSLPPSLAKDIRKRWPFSDLGRSTQFFGGDDEVLSAVWRKFALAKNLIPVSVAQAMIIRDAASPNTEVRSQSAEMAEIASRRGGAAGWAMVLLLQLSHDADITVRMNAARCLAFASSRRSSLEGVVRERVRVLSLESGIGAPIALLQGFMRAATSGGRDVVEMGWWVQLAREMATQSPSLTLRRAAQKLLDEVEGAAGAR